MTGYYKKAFNELENQINELLFEQLVWRHVEE